MPLVNPINRPAVCEGRLTLVSGTAVTQTDQTAKTTVYFTPYRGNRIALFNGVNWDVKTFSEVSVAVPSDLFRLFDVFVYDNAGTITLDATTWDQSTGAITGASAANPCVITDVAHGLSTGDIIGIASITGTIGTDATNGLNGNIYTVTVLTVDTFEIRPSNTAGLAYTSGGTWYKLPNTRTTALVSQDGVQVKTGATSRRYLGTCMTTGTSGQTESSVSNRYVWNYYNQLFAPLVRRENTGSWTYSSATARQANARPHNQLNFVCGIAETTIHGCVRIKCEVSALSDVTVFIGLDGTTALADFIANSIPISAGTFTVVVYEGWSRVSSAGYHFLGWVEQGNGVQTMTFYGQSAFGMAADILC